MFKKKLYILFFCSLFSFQLNSQWEWESIKAKGKPTARSEAGVFAYKNKIYLIGGRRINPTDEFDINTKTWTQKSKPPIEIHHFQPLVIGDAVYIIGALTGPFPNEKAVDRILIYYPDKDIYVFGDSIPKNRKRGAAGLTFHKNKIYMLGGLTNGHMDGFQSWFDSYDISTGKWEKLEDAPDKRDHFQALTLNSKLYAFAGRNTCFRHNKSLDLTNNYGNIYDFETKKWLPFSPNYEIPTKRAGNGGFVWKNEIILGGGESITQVKAHNEVEAFHYSKLEWRNWPFMIEGRHGTGFCIIENFVYTVSGSGNRGGGPELYSIERLKLP